MQHKVTPAMLQSVFVEHWSWFTSVAKHPVLYPSLVSVIRRTWSEVKHS